MSEDIPEFKPVETTNRGKTEIYWAGYPWSDGERNVQHRSIVLSGRIRVVKAIEFLHRGKPEKGDYCGISVYSDGESR